MSESDDHLLFAMSSRGSASWQGFKEIYRSLQLRQAMVGGNEHIQEQRYSLLNCVRTLQSLGHCDFDFTQSTVYVAPPTLVRLPRGGRAAAVLAGARTPSLVEKLLAEAAREIVQVSIHASEASATGIPRRIVAESSSPSALARLAEKIDLPFAGQPASWQLANYSGSVSDYLETLEWLPASAPPWLETAFDPIRLMFTGFFDAEDTLRLSRHEVRGRWDFALWRDDVRASADLDWARFAVANARQLQLLAYDPRQSLFFCASNTPVPMPIAKALALCSGKPMKRVLVPSLAPGHDSQRRQCDCYSDVPASIADIVFDKLGQRRKHATLAH